MNGAASIRRIAVVGLMLKLLPSPVYGAESPIITTSPLRDFGYVIGDEVEHRFSVTVAGDALLETRYLPHPGPVNDSLELRELHWYSEPSGTRIRHDFLARYQIFKGVRQAEQITLPAFPLHFSGTGAAPLASPEQRVTLSPLIPAHIPDASVVIQQNPHIPLPKEPDTRWRLVWGPGLFISLTALALRYRWFWPLTASRPPFARALAALRPLQRGTPPPDAQTRSFRLLHQAFNQTAGYSVISSRLADFLGQHPAYRPLETDIRWFFECSEQLFFLHQGDRAAHLPARLIALSQALSRIERGSL